MLLAIQTIGFQDALMVEASLATYGANEAAGSDVMTYDPLGILWTRRWRNAASDSTLHAHA